MIKPVKENNLEIITKVLKKDERLWSDDKEPQLLKAELISLISQNDEKLINLLISENKIQEQFFKKAGKVVIFKKEKFLQLVTMNEFLPNSFTAFENKIGLQVNGSLLSKNDDMSLVFPHKDCVLEGGQTKEESKRDEIFFNTILAPDEVDRLKEPKVFTNTKRISKNGEEKISEIKETDNMIIKGNNLMTLYSLLPKYRGKIKLIYIDPPYYFKEIKSEDTFTYNSNFKLSTWLTFMKNRLEVAKELMREDGVIFVQTNNDGQPQIKLLLDSVFGSDNYRNNIIWKKLLSAKKQSSNLSNITENILVYSKDKQFKFNKSFLKTEESKDLKNYPYIEEETNRRYGSFDFTQKGKGPARSFNGNLLNPPEGKHWIWDQEKINKGLEQNIIIFTKNGTPRVKRYLDEKEGDPLSDLWVDDDVKIISANDKERKSFNGQKPESLLKRIIEISTNEKDIVLDYHSGTGTTGAVAHKMNRQYIIIEQMNYIHELPEARLVSIIKGDSTGISKSVGWKGGGDFVYTELLEWNQKYIDLLEKTKNKKDILSIKEKIEKEAFYKYQINFDNFDQKEFSLLSPEDQKQVLCDVLDLNHLYVNIGSIEDTTFKVSDADKKFNKVFYNKK